MVNYNETTITGESYQRTNRIIIENPYQGAPVILFEEQKIFNLGDGEVIQKPIGILHVDFDPSEEISIIDPTTNTDTGQTVTMGEIYALIYSVYWQKAATRDSFLAPPLEP
jgi:hypothetical protein